MGKGAVKIAGVVVGAFVLTACAGVAPGSDPGRSQDSGVPSLSLSAPTPTADGAFQIQVNETRDVAIVTVGPANTNIAQIEAAGAAFTGCDAKAGSFLYGAMNNNRDVGIPRELLRSQFGLVALTLTC